MSPQGKYSQDAHDQLGCSSERRPSPKCHAELVGGPEEDQSEDIPGRASFQQRGPNGVEEFSAFHNSPECPLFMLYTKRGEWGSTTLFGPKGTMNCHSEWVSLRCRTPRPWLYSVLTTRTLLVAWNGQTDETIYQGLLTLPSIWGWLPQGPFMPHCGYCSPGSLACWFYKHWEHVGAKPIT